MGDHRACGLVERTIQTKKRRLGVMLLEENAKSIKLCVGTIIRDMRWTKQKTIQQSPFEAHFGRLPKTEFKILRDKFFRNSDYLDKQHLERSVLTANQLKRRIEQSRDSSKIVRKGQKSREVSPLFKQQTRTAQDRDRARTHKALLEANAKWNAERRRLAGHDLHQLVDDTSIIELRKELLYSWERGFVKDKPSVSVKSHQNLLRRDKHRKNGAALTNPLKKVVTAETPTTVTTASGSLYRKNDIAKAAIPLKGLPNSEGKGVQRGKLKSLLRSREVNTRKKI